MQLLYVWIDKYGPLNNIGINLSNKYKFEYEHEDEKGIINYSKDNKASNDFFKSIEKETGVENLSLIIGNNGVGKSLFLSYIVECCSILNSKIEGILIFEEDNEINIYYNIQKDKNVYFKENEKECELKQDHIDMLIDNHSLIFKGNNQKALDFCIDELKNTQIILYSNIFSKQLSRLRNTNNFKNISTNELINSDFSDRYESKVISLDANPNINFFNCDFLRQIDFVCTNRFVNCELPFKLPDYLYVEFVNRDFIIRKICTNLDREYDYSKFKDYVNSDESKSDGARILIKSILKTNKILDENNYHLSDKDINKFYLDLFKLKIYRSIFFNFIDEIVPLRNNNKYDEKCRRLAKKLEKLISMDEFGECDDLFDSIVSFFKDIQNENEDYYFLIKDNVVEQYVKSIKLFKANINKKFMKQIKYNSISDGFILLTNDKGFANIKKFYDEYKLTVKEFNYLNFYWPLSSGENELLNMLSRFYYVTNKVENNKKDIIILIDEGDTYLHPEWQRKYISILLDYLENIFLDKKIQLIVTTHSPILLSDIPGENVVYISKENGEIITEKRDIKTFGANIYNLYKDGFFFNEGENVSSFGVIGEFAMKNIKSVSKLLDDLINDCNITNDQEEDRKKDLVYCKYVINNIGEDFVRNMLQSKLNEVCSKLNLNRDNLEEKVHIKEITSLFDHLSRDDKEDVIKYIINSYRN